ncbi:flavin reductase family protein [Halalkalibacter okhensis]|uniref:Flavin reductase like domain-containing protein n=1 Tax=Halalkalibacter okhensis TaxID=333138 RepID=A0A0B0IF56_9BACI|nr:flavin reductase family protein [Halalkalibacter okhensis]KHF39905.1 hypothetical protein LQ50_12655 [Halalkalibacter okhensis]
MLSINPSELGERENYKFLTGSIIPRPVAIVTSLSEEGILNAAPFSYFNVVSSNPPLISISVQRKNGQMKDTSRNVITRGEFVVHISDETYSKKMNITAKNLPSNESEVEDAGLTPIESLKINVPGIKEARVRMECVLERAISLGGNEESPSCELLIGKIVQYHIQEDLYAFGRIDALKLKPLSRLAGNFYAKLGDTFELERPQ